MYHIITDLETRFRELAEAEYFVKLNQQLCPRVPRHTMAGENTTTPRICVAKTLENCVTALKPMGVFRRCLAANPDAKSYENDDEIYPVIIIKYADDETYVKPDKNLVPDAEQTGEYWLTYAANPEYMQLKWIGAYSITCKWEGRDAICTGITFVDDIANYNHPWLNNKGHPLDSSDLGRELWPRPNDTAPYLALHYPPDQLVYALPDNPFTGFFTCYPLEPNGTYQKPFRSTTDRLHRFTGFYDANNKRIFDKDQVEYNHKTYFVEFHKNCAWALVPIRGTKPIYFHDLNVSNDNQLPDIRLKIQKSI